MPTLGKRIPIRIAPGVSPSTDFTPLDSMSYVNSDKVRFQNGRLRKLAGWQRLFSSNYQRIAGCARSAYYYIPSDGFPRLLIGTSSRLYVYFKGALYNITPLVASTTPIHNALETVYFTDAAYSVTTTNGSQLVTYNIPNFLNVGDTVQISGISGTVGGIGSGALNGTFTVAALPSSNSFQVNVGVTATSSQTGGGSSITFITKQILVHLNNHGFLKGDRVLIAAATSTGGIPNTSINIENIVSAVLSPNVFAITTDTLATSHVYGGGGGSATIQGQIPSGKCDQSQGLGYGGGLYGVGLYGVPASFTISVQYPRIWSFDRFGDNVVLCPGDQGGVYIWANNTNTAPVLQSQAPTANWVYQSHSMIVALCAGGVNSEFDNSNVDFSNQWTVSGVDYARQNFIQGASRLISQATSRNVDLLFTEEKVYQVRFVDLPKIWRIDELFSTDGLIAPKARVNIEDAVFWMGWGDFYVFDGTSVNILPNNTVKRYVYDNINEAQSYKFFAAAHPEYNEVWFFYCAGSDTEPNNYVIYNYKERHWTIGTLNRSAAAEPATGATETLMIQSNITSTVTLGTNPLSTNFYTLGANPITATNSSADIVIAIAGHHLDEGDSITIAGSTSVHGIPSGDINTTLIVKETSVNSITVTVADPATSSGTGGGSGITVATQVITVSYSNNFRNGDQVTLRNATSFGGISVSDLSNTFSVRAWNTNSFDISVASTYSTSQLSGGGDMVLLIYPRTGRLFQHDVGFDDYDDTNCDPTIEGSCLAPMNSFATTNYTQIYNGDNTMLIYSVAPDSTQVGNMSLSVTTKLYPQGSVSVTKGPFTITPIINKVDVMALGRQRQYTISSNELGQDFIASYKWFEEVREVSPI